MRRRGCSRALRAMWMADGFRWYDRLTGLVFFVCFVAAILYSVHP